MRDRFPATAAAALLLHAGSGCSWALVQKPPERPLAPDRPVACTESVAAPVLDTVGAAAMVGLAVGMGTVLSYACIDWSQPPSCPRGAFAAMGALPGAIGAVVYGFSAWYGYRHTASCRELGELERACGEGNQGACRLLREPAGAPEAATPPAEAGRP